jgi:hypothetical protein
MRLFLFAVGGTGSRILKPFIMLCASGLRPVDEDGKPIKDVEIVPIIVDPHRTNEDLKTSANLLNWYKEIRSKIYGDYSPNHGFFSVKISTLSDIRTNHTIGDTFLFNLDNMESKKFKDFISYETMTANNQAICSILFSNTELNTNMSIGFVGSPNIGSVALNLFKDSEEFKQFANCFHKEEGDKVFIISSIFGGTGAAGYPIIAKNIRNASENTDLANCDALSNSIIGALTVMPYFNIAKDKDSQINASDFIIKTKSALEYYQKNLTGSNNKTINCCYYLGDKVLSEPYTNDSGANGQKDMSHFIEYVGAMDIFHFLSISDDKLSSYNSQAENPLFYEYGLKSDVDDSKTLNLNDFPEGDGHGLTELIKKQLIKFHLFYMYLSNRFGSDIGKGYTLDEPKIDSSFTRSNFYRTFKDNFLGAYEEWLTEMSANRRHFSPFNLMNKDIAYCIKDIEPKTGFFCQ